MAVAVALGSDLEEVKVAALVLEVVLAAGKVGA
jgi:hypothetical protein